MQGRSRGVCRPLPTSPRVASYPWGPSTRGPWRDFLLLYGLLTFPCVQWTRFLHPPIGGQSGCLRFLAIVDNAVMSVGCRCLFKAGFSFFFFFLFFEINTQQWNCQIILVVLLLIFGGTSILFSIVSSVQWLHQFTFLPTGHKGSPLSPSSPALGVAGLFDNSHSHRCG